MAIESTIAGGFLGALFAGALIFGIIVSIGIFYVYLAFVFMTLSKKLGYKKHWLAWIPIARWALIPILAKKKWPWVFMFLVPIANVVFFIIWMWKIYERRKYPGALSLIYIGNIIPFLSLVVGIANLVILGLVAWNDRK